MEKTMCKKPRHLTQRWPYDYIQEWLDPLLVSGVVSIDPTDRSSKAPKRYPRLAHLYVTGIMGTTPASAVEILLNLASTHTKRSNVYQIQADTESNTHHMNTWGIQKLIRRKNSRGNMSICRHYGSKIPQPTTNQSVSPKKTGVYYVREINTTGVAFRIDQKKSSSNKNVWRYNNYITTVEWCLRTY